MSYMQMSYMQMSYMQMSYMPKQASTALGAASHSEPGVIQGRESFRAGSHLGLGVIQGWELPP